MAFKTVFIFILSTCLSSLVFASQSPSSAEDQFKLAMKSDSTSPEETRYWLEQSASQGYLPAQKQLAKDYTLGLTGSVFYPQAAAFDIDLPVQVATPQYIAPCWLHDLSTTVVVYQSTNYTLFHQADRIPTFNSDADVGKGSHINHLHRNEIAPYDPKSLQFVR